MAVITMAVSSLSAIGAGVGFADAPALAPQGKTAMQPETPQQQAPAAQQAAPQGTQISPQLSPQLSPTVNLPQNLPLLSSPQAATSEQNNIFRPNMECSPQTVLQANVPIGILADPETRGDTCTQQNSAFRS